MHKLRILSIGKTKESWLEEAIDEYLKRLSKIICIEFVWAKNDEQLLALASKEPTLVCLDANGKMMNSEAFSTFIVKKFEEGGSRLAIVIGGAEGLPTKLKQHPTLISLSPMTFTHQLVRLVLVEQIYRAFEIDKGSCYHK
ncbi:MAG: 23S rRNA (pseudouridine(1915)-N(3))-methyltransferase RlmH [Parachlamydiaceae bacterium]|nr:23S rRNA (pseudouridine(1915)-N(3))-methyltransferase RlmH [Parachlamydiaceae bacterium]